MQQFLSEQVVFQRSSWCMAKDQLKRNKPQGSLRKMQNSKTIEVEFLHPSVTYDMKQ